MNSQTSRSLSEPADTLAITLLPCPFCGSSGPEVLHQHALDGWSVRCEACHIETTEYVNRESAIAAWNRRSPAVGDSPAPAQALALSDEREMLREARLYISQATERDLPGWVAFCKRIDAILSAASPAPTEQPTTLDLTLTRDEVEYIAAFIDTDENEKDDDVVRLLVGPGHGGYGLYAAHPEYPEEGAIFVKAIRASPAPTEGWKLVPVEPTDEMIYAAEKAETRHVVDDRRRGGKDPQLSWSAAYLAMLHASPAPASALPVSGVEGMGSVHSAAPGSEVASPAPFSEPRASQGSELPAKAEGENNG